MRSRKSGRRAGDPGQPAGKPGQQAGKPGQQAGKPGQRARKPGRRAAAFVAAAAVAAGVGALGAGTISARTGTTIHVVEHAITDKEIPTGGGADVKGNVLTFNNPVFNAADKKRVGHDEGYCVRIAPKQGIWECLWTTFLKGGQITVQGPFYDTRNSVLSITGGTGAYRSSRGQMRLVSRHGGKEYDFIFELS